MFVGESGRPGGTDEDANKVYKTFRNELNFAAYRCENFSCTNLVYLIEAAAKFGNYPLGYKFIAFYYAGHGGIDKSGREFVIPSQQTRGGTKSVLYIKGDIISPLTCESAAKIRDKRFFKKHKKNRKSLFFFDCCLNYKPDLNVHGTEKVFNLKYPQDCLVAYATSIYHTSRELWGTVDTPSLSTFEKIRATYNDS